MIVLGQEFAEPLPDSPSDQNTVLQKKYDRHTDVHKQCIPSVKVEVNYVKGSHEEEDSKHDAGYWANRKENPDQNDCHGMVLDKLSVKGLIQKIEHMKPR
jgi:hypothetical protein